MEICHRGKKAKQLTFTLTLKQVVKFLKDDENDGLFGSVRSIF
jgi:hypothetical protein